MAGQIVKESVDDDQITACERRKMCTCDYDGPCFRKREKLNLVKEPTILEFDSNDIEDSNATEEKTMKGLIDRTNDQDTNENDFKSTMKNQKEKKPLAWKVRKPTKMCHLCSKAFIGNKKLKQHIDAVHEKKRPYLCDICSNRFSQEGHLKAHIATVHIGAF